MRTNDIATAKVDGVIECCIPADGLVEAYGHHVLHDMATALAAGLKDGA